MISWTFLAAALLLLVERACYVWIARAPETFRRVCSWRAIGWIGTPIAVVRALFCVFKALQMAAFLGWCYLQGGTLMPAQPEPVALALAWVLMTTGQILSFGVFYRLGIRGVFFGDRLGHPVPWCREFPFSWTSHPQYVGSVLTIWGFFLMMRFPHPDWHLLPVLETLYYAVGARLEEGWETEGRGRAEVGGDAAGLEREPRVYELSARRVGRCR